MQKKKIVLVVAQLMILAAFGIMAGASASPEPVTHYSYEVERADTDEGLPEGCVFIGSFNTENEAKEACHRMGFTNYYYNNGKCYGIK